MLKSTVLKHFPRVQSVAELLDITPAAVYAWPEVVPLESAQAIEILTRGALPVDPALYPKIRRANKLTRVRA